MNSTAQLYNAQSLLQDLGNALSNLVNASPEIFTDEQIQRCLQDFQAAYQEAAQRLAHPSLVIATLGTTSSGKSTIVNALMGRRIAPIEAGEMSGGILHLKHSEERRLVVEETPGAVWETGEWSDLGDAELYARIQTVMNAYHQERRKRDLMAPQVRVQVPLLPARDLKLSGLPEGVEIEFLDLPGLKSVQDRANLAVIQEQMGKAFSLVALDYMQVDEQHRQKLLGEL
ncbi:dynamin family protein, partial [Prochlorothrix hollandica]